MSFEEWWNTKDYPARCKGNCKEAYEAGLHADVHTDNSAVIAELENKIADIKANCDLAIEGRDVKVMELEKENKLLGERCNQLLADKGKLTDELDKWKAEWNEQVIKANEEGFARTLQTIQLTKAKEIIKKFSEFVNKEIEYDPENPQEHTDLWNELCEEAEQFLKEIKEND